MSESDLAFLVFYVGVAIGVSAIAFVVAWLERRPRAVTHPSNEGMEPSPGAGEARSIQEIGHQLKQIGETLSKLSR